MQGTGADLPIAGHQRTHLGIVFNATKQIAVGGMIFKHDRRTVGIFMADHHIGSIHIPQQIALGDIFFKLNAPLLSQMLHNGFVQIPLHGGEVFTHTIAMAVSFLQRLEQWFQCFIDSIVVERAQRFARFPLPGGQLGELLIEQGFKIGDIFVELVTLAIR